MHLHARLFFPNNGIQTNKTLSRYLMLPPVITKKLHSIVCEYNGLPSCKDDDMYFWYCTQI